MQTIAYAHCNWNGRHSIVIPWYQLSFGSLTPAASWSRSKTNEKLFFFFWFSSNDEVTTMWKSVFFTECNNIMINRSIKSIIIHSSHFYQIWFTCCLVRSCTKSQPFFLCFFINQAEIRLFRWFSTITEEMFFNETHLRVTNVIQIRRHVINLHFQSK